MIVDAPPHSRWLLQESVDQLAASYDAAVGAAVALARSAVRYSATAPQPGFGQRLSGRRGGPRTAWLGAMGLGTAVFLAWLSARLVRHFAAAPVAVAVLPGVLLALALAVTATHTASSDKSALVSVPILVMRSWVPLTAAVAACVVWIALALVVTAGVASWTAFACGIALSCGVAAGMLALARPVRPAVILVAGGRPVHRGLRAKRRRAERRLRRHNRMWNQVAHQYSVTFGGLGPAAGALARLLADDEPYDILILTALHRYRPVVIAESLQDAMRPIEREGRTGA
jgi:hypothetical protein